MPLSEKEEFELLSLERERSQKVPAQGSMGPSLREFGQNAARDISGNVSGMLKLASPALPPVELWRQLHGVNTFDPQRINKQGQELFQGIKNAPSQIAQEVTHPIKSFYDRPASTLMDAASVADLGAGGVNLAKNLGKRFVPPLLKATRGLPLEVSKMAIEEPSMMNLAGTSASMQGGTQGIIDAIKEANLKVGQESGKTYSKFGIGSPVDEIKSGSTPVKTIHKTRLFKALGDVETSNISGTPKQTGFGPDKTVSSQETNIVPSKEPVKNFDQLRSDYHDAQTGDLFKKKNLGGGYSVMSDTEKLQTLTKLKRELANQAVYLPGGQQLSPTQKSFDVAVKSMVKDVEKLRDAIPGGSELGLADDAWHEMQEIRERLWKQFKDPYTGQDYLNRILKGNTDWLTSGRNAGRVGAIERVEEITGKSVLKPALKEIAAAYIKNPDVLSLPSFKLTSMLGSLVPKKTLLKAASGVVSRAPAASITSALQRFRKRNEDPVPQ